MRADIAVWSSNLYDLEDEPERLLAEHAALTLVGGKVAHDDGALA